MLMPLSPLQDMTWIGCGHKFCNECWRHYLTTKIMNEGQGKTIACAEHDCDILVDDQTVFNLIDDQRIRKRYHHLVINSFVEVSFFFNFAHI